MKAKLWVVSILRIFESQFIQMKSKPICICTKIIFFGFLFSRLYSAVHTLPSNPPFEIKKWKELWGVKTTSNETGRRKFKEIRISLVYQPATEQGSALLCPTLCAPIAHLETCHATLCFNFFLCLHSVNSDSRNWVLFTWRQCDLNAMYL